jgi:hypothetical protein
MAQHLFHSERVIMNDTVLKDYAVARAAHTDSKSTLHTREVAAFRYLPQFATGNTFTTVERKLKAIDESLPRLLAANPSALTRNLLVGLVSTVTDADDLSRIKSLTNRYASMGLGIPAQKALLNGFAGDLDAWEDTLKSHVSADDELDALKDKLASLAKQAKKIRARIAELEAGATETVF